MLEYSQVLDKRHSLAQGCTTREPDPAPNLF